ncbi:hypothetical protein OL548_25965 [Lysinibacillus sp. MHQ-1]|nr:hypothetical protein OL548_25965 [Lysinibacillus sp. MHQ-1]
MEHAIVYCINVDPIIIGGHDGSIFMTNYVQPYLTTHRQPYLKLTKELTQKSGMYG